jgi:hypothetical protein
MNRERAKELWPIIKAYGEGKEVESRFINPRYTWGVQSSPFLDDSSIEYRIKPEPKMRPMTRGEVLYVLSTPHCACKNRLNDGPPFILGIPDDNQDVGDPITIEYLIENIDYYEYAIIDESGEPVDGWHKFEKEIQS